MAISYCYLHLVVTNGNLTLLLTSSGHKWQFNIANDMVVVTQWSIFTLLMTSSGHECQFHISTDI